jgi:hypothetical protein
MIQEVRCSPGPALYGLFFVNQLMSLGDAVYGSALDDCLSITAVRTSFWMRGGMSTSVCTSASSVHVSSSVTLRRHCMPMNTAVRHAMPWRDFVTPWACAWLHLIAADVLAAPAAA